MFAFVFSVSQSLPALRATRARQRDRAVLAHATLETPDGNRSRWKRWLLQDKLRENYIQSAFGDDIEQAQKQLHLAVIRGEIRGRLKGRLLGPEWLKQIGKMTFMEGEPFALPGDLELSVEDARRKFGT